jgi:ABC-type Fe3+ transport system substrate-binding protein
MSAMRRHLLRVLVCATLLAVPLVANAAAASWNDAPKVQALYEAARREGKVIIWGTHRREVDWIAAAFGKMFPGIEVEFLGDNDIAVKAIAEARAGRHQVDVFWHSMTGHLPVVQRDLLVANDWSLFAVDPRNTAFDGRMGFTSNIVYAIAYNTKAATAADVPTNWAGAVDERLKGKATGSTFLLPRLIGALGIAWGEDKALDFARGLRDRTDILLTRAPRESLLQSGERIFAFGEIDSQVRGFAADGLPVAMVVPEPVVMGQFGASVVKDAPHPNAARLLAGFLASPDGKRSRLAATGQADYGPTSENELARKIHSGQLQVVRDSADNMVAREKLFGRAAAILTGQAR